MPDDDVDLYFDLGSPYAYLTVARAERDLGIRPVLRPILLGAIFQRRGFGSWAATAQRDPRVAEIEARAARYDLPIVWPPGWPLNGLTAMRATIWAERHGGLDRFARAVFHHEFGLGQDTSTLPVLTAIADEAGLPGAELAAAVRSDEIKQRLREATDAAWDRGVRGVPTIAIGRTLLYGDDQLEQVPFVLAG